MQARLILLDPPAVKRELKLTLPATVGRSRDAKVKVVHGQVSRVHCEFFDRDGLLYVRDLGSTNGTYVGDERITESVVRPGDTVTLGSVKFRAMYELAQDAVLPTAAFVVTDTIRKAGEATYRAPSPELAEPSPTAEASKIEEGDWAESLEDWDLPPLVASDAAATEAPPPLHPADTASAPAELQASEWDDIELDELEAIDELPPAQTEHMPSLPSDSAGEPAADDSLNILPPPSEGGTTSAQPVPELEWRVPEPSSPGASEFGFDLEEHHEAAPPPTAEPAPPGKPAKTDDEDLEKFFKSLE